jgi:type IV pilus assembly protein PilW
MPSLLRQRSGGLTLVEIMVGLAIGLIGIVAMFQAVSVWSKHTAATSSGGDAQVAGTLALFNIERDVKQAGHGFSRATPPVLGSPVALTDTAPVRAINFPLSSVQITFGAGGAPDQIGVLYGDSSFYVEVNDFTGATATTKTLRRRGGFKVGDFAVVAYNPGALPASANCQLVQITADNNPDGRTVDHTTTPFVSFYTPLSPATASRFNSAVAPLAVAGTMYNLGPQPRLDVWSIQNGRILVRSDLIGAGPAMQIAEGVVNLKAQYGFDADGDGTISAAEWLAAPPAPPADWSRLLAIRVAVLVRGRQFERTGDSSSSGVRAATPTAANPTYFGANPFLMTNVDGTPDTLSDVDAVPNNWRFYRYRVYERVIPLRNVLWGNWG